MGWESCASKPLVKINNLLLHLRRYGLAGTIKLYGFRSREIYRDWRLRIRTAGYIEAEALGHGQDCIAYEPIHYRCLDTVFEYLKPQPDCDVFLDYGCGKGRAVVTAATYPFRRVIGVELSPELSDVARQNVHSAARKLICHDVEIITGNAVNFEVPPDVTVVFLFNPFTGDILSAVQERILESIKRSPRSLRLVYMHPTKDADALSDCDWLIKLCDLPTADWDNVKLKVYENCGTQ